MRNSNKGCDFMCCCDYCKKEVKSENELEEVILDGEIDLYVLNVCEECAEVLNDVYSPETIDAMMGN